MCYLVCHAAILVTGGDRCPRREALRAFSFRRHLSASGCVFSSFSRFCCIKRWFFVCVHSFPQGGIMFGLSRWTRRCSRGRSQRNVRWTQGMAAWRTLSTLRMATTADSSTGSVPEGERVCKGATGWLNRCCTVFGCCLLLSLLVVFCVDGPPFHLLNARKLMVLSIFSRAVLCVLARLLARMLSSLDAVGDE